MNFSIWIGNEIFQIGLDWSLPTKQDMFYLIALVLCCCVESVLDQRQIWGTYRCLTAQVVLELLHNREALPVSDQLRNYGRRKTISENDFSVLIYFWKIMFLVNIKQSSSTQFSSIY